MRTAVARVLFALSFKSHLDEDALSGTLLGGFDNGFQEVLWHVCCAFGHLENGFFRSSDAVTRIDRWPRLFLHIGQAVVSHLKDGRCYLRAQTVAGQVQRSWSIQTRISVICITPKPPAKLVCSPFPMAVSASILIEPYLHFGHWKDRACQPSPQFVASRASISKGMSKYA